MYVNILLDIEILKFLCVCSLSQEAEKSIRFYQNMQKNQDYELLQLEINKLKSAFDNSKSEKPNDVNSFKWSELTSNPGRKAMIIGIVLMVLNQFRYIVNNVQC